MKLVRWMTVVTLLAAPLGAATGAAAANESPARGSAYTVQSNGSVAAQDWQGNTDTEGENEGGSGGETVTDGSGADGGGSALDGTNPDGVNPDTFTTDELLMRTDSAEMILNGLTFQSVQPLVDKDGVLYAPLKTLAASYGYKIGYNKTTKESTAVLGNKELRFKSGSAVAVSNGEKVMGAAPAYTLKGSLMVPVATWAMLTGSVLHDADGEVRLQWTTRPIAAFTVSPKEIFAGQTMVDYRDRASHPRGLPIINEEWTGRESIFLFPGEYTITRRVQDVYGIWSEPYSVTIKVLQPNMPPVADFTTDKSVYRIGEPIVYTDRSTDDGNDIRKRTWKGKEPAFFEPGEKTITLQVEDGGGLKSEKSVTVYITDEVMYTREEFGLRFTPVGEKYAISGGAVLDIPTVPYTFRSQKAQMVRSNSPETWVEEGIAYEDRLKGEVRFLFHNLNQIGRPVKMYLIATNPNRTSAKVGIKAFGMGGPIKYVSTSGRLSTARYLESLAADAEPVWTSLKPGESKVIMNDLNKVPIKPGQVFSAYGDVVTDKEIQFRIVVLDPSKDPLTEMDTLKIMPRDGLHVRGTFYDADRELVITEPLGYEPKRIVLGDRKMDTYLYGLDSTTGRPEHNLGNFGVLYRMKVEVAPNTVVALNARGGHYTGAFLINGQVVKVTNDSILRNANEAAVLYRTGPFAETLDIVFTLASGSNLPVTMMFLPIS